MRRRRGVRRDIVGVISRRNAAFVRLMQCNVLPRVRFVDMYRYGVCTGASIRLLLLTRARARARAKAREGKGRATRNHRGLTPGYGVRSSVNLTGTVQRTARGKNVKNTLAPVLLQGLAQGYWFTWRSWTCREVRDEGYFAMLAVRLSEDTRCSVMSHDLLV